MSLIAINNQSSSWINVDDNIHKFDLNAEYRIILKQENEFDEDEYAVIYMSFVVSLCNLFINFIHA